MNKKLTVLVKSSVLEKRAPTIINRDPSDDLFFPKTVSNDKLLNYNALKIIKINFEMTHPRGGTL